jgi:DHA1 family bicyclomycin/chloramphenicol resistance-like MFS transporter
MSWHAALLALALFGAATLGVIAWRFEETLAAKNPRALEPMTLVRTWLAIVRNPTFLAFSALATTSYAGLFTFLATSSFVFIQLLGLSTVQYGLVMLGMSAVYVLSTFLCRGLLARIGLPRTVALAGCISITGGTLMGTLALSGVQSVWAIALPHAIFMLGHGIHQPCGQSGAVGPFPKAAGAASALNGFLMMVVAFGMGHWLGIRMDGTVLPLALGLWFWSVLIALTAWTLVQRYGKT